MPSSACCRSAPRDAVLGILPMFHVLAQMANLLLPLVKGARVVYLETLNTTELLRALQERQITAFAVVPQFFYLIHERIFKEVSKRGRIAESVLRSLMRMNRFLRKLRAQCRQDVVRQNSRDLRHAHALPHHRRLAL